jgi:uncharacterized protein (DUF433 family)
MIAPIARFSLRSFLFFQGENDVSTEASTPGWYACRFNRLIASTYAMEGRAGGQFAMASPVLASGLPCLWLELAIAMQPEILGGTLVFQGTRVPAQTLLDYRADGFSLDEFLALFPSVRREDAMLFLSRCHEAGPAE